MKKGFLLFIVMSFLLIACGQSVEPIKDIGADNDSPEVDTKEVVAAPKETSEKKKGHKAKTPQPSTDLTIHYIDAGQADATLFQYTYENKPYTILYDVGDWNKNDVVNYLTAQGISFIDLVIVSHPHADHAGQLPEIMNTFEVGEVWLSGNTTTSNNFQKGLEAVLASNADYYEPRSGDTFDIGPLTIDVLNPSSISGKLNEESISLLFTYGENKFLFTGDAGKKEELNMINSGFNVQADILQLGHHGSNTSTDPKFMKAVNPAIAIYSAGTGNSYGHPHADVVSLIQNAGIKLYGTDVHGTILVKSDGKEYTVQAKQNGTISPNTTGGATSKKEITTKEKTAPKKENKTPASNACIDINKAPMDDIKQIIHIGPARAEDLINLRPFNTIDDLHKIKGIGPARIVDIKNEGKACVK